MKRFLIIFCSVCLLLVILMFVGKKSDGNEIKDTTGLIQTRVCLDDVNMIILGNKKAVKLNVSYTDLWGERRKKEFAVYGYMIDYFKKGDSVTMYQNPLSPKELKYKKGFD